jgi:transposase
MYYLGIDVSKAKLDAKLLVQAQPVKFRSKTVPNTASGIATLLAWSTHQAGCELSQLHVLMEATGPYHERAAATCFDAGARVSVLNPAQVKEFARGLAVKSKNDSLDSAVLARYGALLQPPPWQPEAREIRELKALLQRLDTIETELRRELNRREKTEHSQVPPAVQQSLEDNIQFLSRQQKQLQQRINDHIDNHPTLRRDRELLKSIPAVGDKTAFRMLALLRSRSFVRASQAAAFVGLVPIEHQSGSSVCRRPRLSKAGDARVRAALYMAAIVATRHNPDIRAQYQRLLANGKSKMSALGAAMRKLLHICFGVLKHQTPYAPQCEKMTCA